MLNVCAQFGAMMIMLFSIMPTGGYAFSIMIYHTIERHYCLITQRWCRYRHFVLSIPITWQTMMAQMLPLPRALTPSPHKKRGWHEGSEWPWQHVKIYSWCTWNSISFWSALSSSFQFNEGLNPHLRKTLLYKKLSRFHLSMDYFDEMFIYEYSNNLILSGFCISSLTNWNLIYAHLGKLLWIYRHGLMVCHEEIG